MADQKVEYNYLQKIIEFNSDKDIIALREKYKEPTFFEIISKQRSETTYSSFLKWMFQSSSTDLGTVSPILLLLDVLVSQDHKGLIDDAFKKYIITRNIKINNIEVETEKSVSALASELISRGVNNFEKLDEKEIIQVIEKSQDRIDIFIKCNVEVDNKKEKLLQIIIENKIDSMEGGGKCGRKVNDKYDKASQTNRYYMASALKNKKNITQLYVYLAPAGADECGCDKYIQINYQDIVDKVVSPMLASSKLSIRERFFLEELKTELTFPSLEGSDVKSSIALSGENTEKFTDLWKNYKDLVIASAIAASDDSFWSIEDGGITTYYDKFPKDVILKEIEEKTDITNLQGKVKNKTVIEKAQENGIKVVECKYKDDLLKSFWNNNKRFLLAFMNGIDKKEYKMIECLTQEISKRDSTKYTVYYNNENLNIKWLLDGKTNKPKFATNAETAWLIIKAWAELKNNERISLDELNNVFTRENCNTYYKSGKWLKNLFHVFNSNGEYFTDGDKNQKTMVEAGGWDFYKPNDSDDRKFRISTTEGEDYAIMLKMWRKDGLQKLIDLVTNPNNNYFKEGTLIVQPDK